MKLTIKNFVLLSVWVSPKNLSGVSGVRERGQACNVTKSDTPAWAFFTFFKLYKWYQNGRSVSCTGETLQEWREAKRSRFQRVEDSALIAVQVKTPLLVLNSVSIKISIWLSIWMLAIKATWYRHSDQVVTPGMSGFF